MHNNTHRKSILQVAERDDRRTNYRSATSHLDVVTLVPKHARPLDCIMFVLEGRNIKSVTPQCQIIQRKYDLYKAHTFAYFHCQ